MAYTLLLLILFILLVNGKDLSAQANCSQEIAWIFQNITDLNITPYLGSSDFLNSGHFLNNLGEYDECQDDPHSSYSLLQISITGISTFFTGICTVKECDSSKLSMVKKK
jgi:hypothetical protein